MSEGAPSSAIPPTALSDLRGDLVAGVTGGILAVPQGIAFALIANVPPEHGLYAMVVPTVVAALVRRSPYLVTGATNTSALVIGGLVGTLALPAAEIVPTMLLITLLMGVIQVACGAMRLGGAGRYVSQAVLVGFTLGAATLIAADQVRNILGVDAPSSVRFYETLERLSSAVGSADPRALALAVLTWLVLAGSARISRLVPGAMIAVVATVVLVSALGWDGGPNPVALVGEIPRGLPPLTLPALSIERAHEVFGASVAIAILGMVEAISIGKALSAKARIKFEADRELLAKGTGNVAGAFFGCLPTSASWTRSALNLQMGARTRWVGVIAGTTVLVIMLLFAPWARHVPTACVGAVIAWIAYQMIDLQAARYVWRWSRTDATVLVVTYLSTLVFPIQYAIYLGVFVSLAQLVSRAGRLHLVEIAAAGNQSFREIEIDDETGSHPIVLLQLEGDLFFGVVDELEERLQQIAARGAKAILIRLKRAHAVDASAAEALASFAEQFREDGGRLVLCGVRPELLEQIGRSHLGEVLGPENLLPSAPQPFGSIRQAIESVRRELTEKGLRSSDEPFIRPAPREVADAWSYSI